MSRTLQAYLTTYNALQTIAWSYILFKCLLISLSSSHGPSRVFEATASVVHAAQSAALLETVHSALGAVRSNPINAFQQWLGRMNVTFALVSFIPQVQSKPVVALLYTVWALGDLARYPQYVATLLGRSLYVLDWIRYSAFIPLYPIGVAAEVRIILLSLPIVKERQLHYLPMPNKLNFAFDYFLFLNVALVLYLPLFSMLYMSLWRTRAKKLGGSKAKSSEKKIA